jgi:hypothetical protein
MNTRSKPLSDAAMTVKTRVRAGLAVNTENPTSEHRLAA